MITRNYHNFTIPCNLVRHGTPAYYGKYKEPYETIGGQTDWPIIVSSIANGGIPPLPIPEPMRRDMILRLFRDRH